MKRVVALVISFVLCAVLPALATGYGIYWVGNSLMSGGWACYEGWDLVGKMMINPDSSTLGITVHSSALKRGATDIPEHWKADLTTGYGSACTGTGELQDPTGCITYGYPEPWNAQQGNYDYVALQGYRWSYWATAQAAMDTQVKYCSNYYDLGLQNGTKPIIFACWQSPQTADVAIGIYDSLYRKYRGQGALYLPVIQAHRLTWHDRAKDSLTYLYDNDPFHHTNRRGGFLMACVIYEVFTGRSPVGLTKADFKRACTDPAMDSISDADIIYLEQKAHQAVVDFYGEGNIPHLGIDVVKAVRKDAALKPATLFSKAGTRMSVDLTGRKAGMAMRSSKVIVARDAAGRLTRMVIGDR